ncbi:fimbrial biogenesis chaperone [Providencia sp. PROV152]|uniref:Molecular chaperone n=1 Tax=Providencia stuartii TaxID=588 RepID=A0AAI9I2M7_PROST|nr:molecular chaperone [Providencia sp. PROV152]ELR5037114.1 molecular chaperone [Providencia stuartii]
MLQKIIIIISIFFVSPLFADGISLNQSRVIFSAQDNSQIVQLKNDTDGALLVQATVLDAVDGKQIDNFIVVPPLFRSEPRSEYSMRVRKNNVLQLPKDKESIFFLKMRAIPPIDKKNENESNMSVVFVTAIVIKVYYRPEGISAPKISDYRKVVIEKANNKWQLNNPTPYYMTIVDFSLNGKKIQEKIMIPPFNTYGLDRFVANTNSVKGSWRFVTDYGSITDKFNF